MGNKLVLWCMILSLGMSLSASANILINGGFEDGDIGQVGSVEIPGWNSWGDAGWHNNDAGATIDSKAMKFWWDSVGMWQDYTAIAGTMYVYSAQVMDWSGDTSANNWDLQIEAEFYDAANNLLASEVLDLFDSGIEPDDTWIEIGGSVLAPAGTAYGRVVMRMVDWQEDISGSIYFDNVSVAVDNNPLNPHDPSPVFGAEKVGTPLGDGTVDVTFEWVAGLDPSDASQVNPAITEHYIYISNPSSPADPNLIYQGSVERISSTDPNTLLGPVSGVMLENTTYQWAVVDALNGYEQTLTPGVSVFAAADPNNLIGPVWSFITAGSLPEIITQPENANIAAGTTDAQVFSLTVASLTTESYQWYYSTDAVVDAGDDEIGGAISAVLTLDTITAADEGYYYCKVYNASTISGGGAYDDAYSDVVLLVAGRIVGEYLFENNLDDNTTEANHGIAKDLALPDPNDAVLAYGAGIEGDYALQLDGSGQYINLGTGAYPRAGLYTNGRGGGIDEGSVTCWVKAWQIGGLLSNYNSAHSGSGFGFFLVGGENGVNAWTHLRDENGDIGIAQGRPGMTGFNMLDDQWHMVGVTWKQGGSIQMYVDGGRVDVADAGAMTYFLPWQAGMLIGANRNADRTGLEAFYGGLIDDMKIYNYIRTPDQMANDYYTLTGEPACANPEFIGNVYNFDNSESSYCKVDLADFAVFVLEGWLTDGLSTGQ